VAAVKRKRAAVLHIMTTPTTLAVWRRRARESGMSLREWVERSLEHAPALEMRAQPIIQESDA
jgi:hypothetical protein